MEPIEKYNRLYKEDLSNTNEKYIFTERLETRSKIFQWKIEPHIHPDIYQIVLMETGSLLLQTSDNEHQIESPFLLIIPSAVMHGFEYSENSSGSITSLESSVVNDIITKHTFLASLFTRLEIISLSENSDTQNRILQTIDYIDRELHDFCPQKSSMLNILLQELFIVIFRLWESKLDSNKDSKDFNPYRYFIEFQSIIRKMDSKVTVNEIAHKIGITAVHLNRICNQVADKPASILMNEQKIKKAKNYLIYTSYSISEIAYFLNFEYPNYFSKFFKKHTGMSPNEYRQKK